MIEDTKQEIIDIELMSKYLKDVQDFHDTEQYLMRINDMDNFEDKEKIYTVLDKYIEILSSFGIHIYFEHIYIYNIYRSKLINILNIFTPGYINEILENSITDIRDKLINILEDDTSDDEDDFGENIILNLIEFLSSIEISDDIFTDIIVNIEIDDSYIELIKEVINNSVDVQETGIDRKINKIGHLKKTINEIYSLNRFVKETFDNVYYRNIVNKIIKYFTVIHIDTFIEKEFEDPYTAYLLHLKEGLKTFVKGNALPLSISYHIENDITKIDKYQLLLIIMTERFLNCKWHPNYAHKNDIETGIDELVKHVIDDPEYSRYKIDDKSGLTDIVCGRINHG